jgi:putative ABC transport system permease protein
MLRNYIKIALRNIAKQRFYSLINILGLSIGFACTLLVVLYITDETSYDQFNSQIDRMYRVGLNGKIGDQEVMTSNTCPPLWQALLNEVPEVEKATRLNRSNNVVISYREESYTEDNVYWADSTFFDVFDYQLASGDPNTALAEPNSIILTQEMARKYFDDEEPLGKILTIGNDQTSYKVTGVLANQKVNSHFEFNFLRSAYGFEYMNSPVWLNNFLSTYFIVHEGADISNIQPKLDDMVIKYVGPEVQQYMGVDIEQFRQAGNKYGFFIGKVSDIHLRSDLDDELEPGGDIAYIYMFGAIGAFILLIACINFMNLSTAKSAGRAREVGLRKTFGSLRSSMVIQFLTESMIFSIFSALFGLVLIYIALPEFNTLTGKELEFAMLGEGWVLGSMALILLSIGLIAGSYPAFYLTSFKITDVLKGKLSGSGKNKFMRSTLVVFQFFISITLIVSTIIVYQQISYTQEKNLGFEKEGAIIIDNMFSLDENMSAFKNKLQSRSTIETASYSNYVFPGINNTTIFRVAGSEDDFLFGTYVGDYDHIEAMGFEIVEGRGFSKEFPTDSSAILINEAAVKEIGWEDPIGKEMLFQGNQKLTVIGVLRDFNFESLKNEIRPMALRFTERGNYMTVRYSADNPNEVLKAIEADWKEFGAGKPLEYTFLDERFDQLYETEQKVGAAAISLTSIAILIACLGLFGLAAFMAEKRTKEIGIRKSLGASEFHITRLLSAEFVKLISIAFVLSIFPAYYFMNSWLEGFAYRIAISPFNFIVAGLLAIFIALLTVSYQSIKASLTNPVNALKYE